MSTTIESIDANTSRLTVGGVEALRFGSDGGIRVAHLNGSQIAGNRRRNLNGGCDIAQAGVSFAAIPSGSWSLDGFRFGIASDGAVTVSQTADAPTDNEFQNSIRATVTTADAAIAAGQFAFHETVLEGFDIRDFIGKPFTISFWVRSAKTGVHCLALRNSGNDRSYVAEYTVNAANTWEKKSVTISVGLITAGTWNWTNGSGMLLAFIMACGTTFQTSANAWQTGNFISTSNQVNCMDTVGNIFAITGLQVEPGLVSTPFEHILISTELARCQRYYELGHDHHDHYFSVGSAWTNFVNFKVVKRANPTVSATFTYSNTSAGIIDTLMPSGFRGWVTAGVGSTAYAFDWIASARLP